MSFHSTPASARARRIAIAPISMPVTPGNRPNGCSPTPMTATSLVTSSLLDGPERERDHVVAIFVGAQRHEHELHLHAVAQHGGIGGREPALHLDVAEVDVAHAERHKVL